MDISFWLSNDEIIKNDDKIFWMRQNDFMDIVRSCMDTNVEKVELIDEFFHPKKQQYSQCWKMTLSPNNDIVDSGLFHSLCVVQMKNMAEILKNSLNLDVR